MGTAKVEKILIATHEDERDELLRRLQEEGLVHIADFNKKGDDTSSLSPTQAPQNRDVKDTLARLNQAILFLTAYAGKRKTGFLAGKPSLPAVEFRRRVKELGLNEKLSAVKQLSETSSQLDAEERQVKNELELLEHWSELKHPPVEYTALRHADSRFVFISSIQEGLNLREALKPLLVNAESVKKQGDTEYMVLLFPKEETEAVEDALKTTGARMIDLSGFKAKPSTETRSRSARLAEIEMEREAVREEAGKIAAELTGFETALDHYQNEELLCEQYSKIPSTSRASFIEGWVRCADRKRLENTVADFQASEVVSVKQGKDEEIPVALRNPAALKPFELILNMYGTPNGREMDPTPITAPFFAVFFALCLTDAAYGVLIAAVSAWLIWGKKIRNDLVWILFYGGILTIFAGAMTSSWFGNLPDMLGIPWLIHFRDALTWFDPLKDPMPFFYLSLALGYFQMMFGMGVEVADGIRTRDYGPALFETLPWFVIFLAVPAMIATGMGVLPGFLSVPLLVLVIVSLAVSLVLSNRPGPTSVTSAILLWAVMTSALLAAAKGFGMLPVKGIIIKALLVGTIAALWLYTLFKGLSEKRMKVFPIVAAVLTLALLVLYVSGVLKGNLYLALGFVLNLVFAFSVLKGWAGRIVWGAYGVYSNATGVLGIILSYVRLMALGMTTAGIAMAFNQIAWMFKGIPVLSMILMIAVLAVGHLFNLAMNALGGFVHSLRLQYVEYFPRFFSGGGVRFEPFELKTRYVNVTRRQ